MKVMVTGSAGLIGKEVCSLLEARGDEVRGYDITRDLDVMDKGNVDFYVMSVWHPDAIIHLAAQSLVDAAKGSPYNSWMLNVVGTLNVLEAARNSNVPVVIASSNHVYGHQSGWTKEDAQLTALDTYSATKICADVMARSYHQNYGTPTAVIRNTNCYGPLSPHPYHIVEASAIHCLKNEDLHLRTNGTAKKGYLHVHDVATAYLTVMDALVNGSISGGEAFNVTGDIRTAREIWEQVKAMTGSTANLIPSESGEEQHDEFLDDTKIENLGWRQTVTLDEGLEMVIESYRGVAV